MLYRSICLAFILLCSVLHSRAALEYNTPQHSRARASQVLVRRRARRDSRATEPGQAQITDQDLGYHDVERVVSYWMRQADLQAHYEVINGIWAALAMYLPTSLLWDEKAYQFPGFSAHSSLFNAVGPSGATPLQIAIVRGELQVVKWLIARGAQVGKPARYERKPLSPVALAIIRGQCEILEFLLEQNQDIAVETQGSCVSPLHLAIAVGKPDIVNLLVAYGAHRAGPKKERPFLSEICFIRDLLEALGVFLAHAAKDDAEAYWDLSFWELAIGIAVRPNILPLVERREAASGDDQGKEELLFLERVKRQPNTFRLFETMVEEMVAYTQKQDMRDVNPFQYVGHLVWKDLGKKEGRRTPAYVYGSFSKASDRYTPLMLAKKEGHQEIITLMKSHSPVRLFSSAQPST